MTPEIKAQIDVLRQKIASGTYTIEDAKIAVEMYREARGVVMTNTEKKATEKVVKKKTSKTAEELLGGFMGEGDANL